MSPSLSLSRYSCFSTARALDSDPDSTGGVTLLKLISNQLRPGLDFELAVECDLDGRLWCLTDARELPQRLFDSHSIGNWCQLNWNRRQPDTPSFAPDCVSSGASDSLSHSRRFRVKGLGNLVKHFIFLKGRHFTSNEGREKNKTWICFTTSILEKLKV